MSTISNRFTTAAANLRGMSVAHTMAGDENLDMAMQALYQAWVLGRHRVVISSK
ncbi:hypothetical protein [Aeromonas sp. MdU4]|uniref:hypothetical protein n=1 Tax=Aeromonas sp. MdU4 TaxID=3342819 RepID=UPI0035B81D5E